MNISDNISHVDDYNKNNKSLFKSIIIVLIIIVVGFFIGKYIFFKVMPSYNSVGDTIECNKFEITVNNVQFRNRGTELDSYTSISEPEWIGVTLTVKNIGNRTKVFSESMIEVQNSKNEVLKSPVFDYNIWGITELGFPKLKVDEIKTGYIHFTNTNTDHSNIRLIFKCSDNEAITFKLTD